MKSKQMILKARYNLSFNVLLILKVREVIFLCRQNIYTVKDN
jgi:hypothetical protein